MFCVPCLTSIQLRNIPVCWTDFLGVHISKQLHFPPARLVSYSGYAHLALLLYEETFQGKLSKFLFHNDTLLLSFDSIPEYMCCTPEYFFLFCFETYPHYVEMADVELTIQFEFI